MRSSGGPPSPLRSKCFRWQFMLDRLPIRNKPAAYDRCSICRKPETACHIFFDCPFAREVWLLFGIAIIESIFTYDIVTSFIHGPRKDTNLVWQILSSYILWFIWKLRNEEKFQGITRERIEFFKKLTHYKIVVKVCFLMNLERNKLL